MLGCPPGLKSRLHDRHRRAPGSRLRGGHRCGAGTSVPAISREPGEAWTLDPGAWSRTRHGHRRDRLGDSRGYGRRRAPHPRAAARRQARHDRARVPGWPPDSRRRPVLMIARARIAALRVLQAVDGDRADLPGAIAQARTYLADERDRALLVELTTGTLRWLGTID